MCSSDAIEPPWTVSTCEMILWARAIKFRYFFYHPIVSFCRKSNTTLLRGLSVPHFVSRWFTTRFITRRKTENRFFVLCIYENKPRMYESLKIQCSRVVHDRDMIAHFLKYSIKSQKAITKIDFIKKCIFYFEFYFRVRYDYSSCHVRLIQ